MAADFVFKRNTLLILLVAADVVQVQFLDLRTSLLIG